MRVADIMAQKSFDGVIGVAENETMSALVSLLGDRRIGACVVTDASDKLCGVISERDVVRSIAKKGASILGEPVSAHMTAEVQTAKPEDSAVSVLERMSAGRFRHMPVLENGELVGLVSIGDLVSARINALQADNEALEAFIRG